MTGLNTRARDVEALYMQTVRPLPARRLGVSLAAILLACFACAGAWAQPAPPPPSVHPPLPPLEQDRNGDGKVDYTAVQYARCTMVSEEFDFNYDGVMDDFYYYKDGVFVREEIDSDFNGKIDIWIYLADGKYVERWERDTDGDGKPDKSRSYGIGE